MLHVPLGQKLTIAKVLGSVFSDFLLLCNRNTIVVMYLTTLRNRYNLDSKIGTACRVHHSRLFSVMSFRGWSDITLYLSKSLLFYVD